MLIMRFGYKISLASSISSQCPRVDGVEAPQVNKVELEVPKLTAVSSLLQ
jgi:hypothetical protein